MGAGMQRPAPLDALGRPVPGWALEAFDILAADGRRVGVEAWPNDNGKDMHESDASLWRYVGYMVVNICGAKGMRGACEFQVRGESLADCARRALAMEAERKGPGLIAQLAAASHKTDPTIEAPSIKAAQDAEIARRILGLTEPAPRRHNTHCPRCYGPAYQGAGAVLCEREGGCLVDAEPTVFAEEPHWTASGVFAERHSGETEWYHQVGTGGNHGPFATRGLAVAAWREAVLARAKREAGL